MTVSSETVRTAAAGNGGTTSFPTGFIFEDNDHVSVSLIVDATGAETAWVEGTQYTLTGAGTGTAGTLTVDTSPTDYTPQSGETLVMVRDIPYTQETDFPVGGAFPSNAVETAFDLAAMRDAKLAFDIGRTLHAPTSDDNALDMELPNTADRADKYLFFNSDGEPTAVASVDTSASNISAFGESLVDDANAAAARTTLGLGTAATQATGTSGANVPLLNGNNTHSGTSTFTGATTVTATLDAQQQRKLSGVITPSQITGDQNNYNPTGLSTASILRLTSDTTRTITGLAGGAAGREIIIFNDNASAVIALDDESSSSDAENRFALNGVINIAAQQAATLWYDSTDQRWRCSGRYVNNASSAVMVLAATNSLYVSPGVQHRHPGHPKFCGVATVSGGTPTLDTVNDYNITSITDTNPGQLTVTIATDFSGTNWVPHANVERAATALTVADIAQVEVRNGGKAAGTVLLECWDDTATTHVAEDPASWSFSGLGTQ